MLPVLVDHYIMLFFCVLPISQAKLPVLVFLNTGFPVLFVFLFPFYISHCLCCLSQHWFLYMSHIIHFCSMFLYDLALAQYVFTSYYTDQYLFTSQTWVCYYPTFYVSLFLLTIKCSNMHCSLFFSLLLTTLPFYALPLHP